VRARRLIGHAAINVMQNVVATSRLGIDPCQAAIPRLQPSEPLGSPQSEV